MANGLLESITWRDVKGNTATTRFYLADTGTAITQAAAGQAILNAMLALSNAAFQTARGPLTNVARQVVYGTAAQFLSVEDKATFTFSAADGSIHRIKVPAPKIALFEVDQETIDNSQSDVATFITAFLANAVTAAGAALITNPGGIRQRTKLKRKLSVWTLVPELDEPAE